MRDDREKNAESIYFVILSIQEKNWYEDVSPKEIVKKLNSYMPKSREEQKKLSSLGWKRVFGNRSYMKKEIARKTIYNCLNEQLIKDKRVQKMERGKYSTDVAIKIRKDIDSSYKKMLSFSSGDLKGHSISTFLGKPFAQIPIYPPVFLKSTEEMSRIINNWRLDVHGNEEIAKKETNIWISSFLDNLMVEIGYTGQSLKMKPGSRHTTIRQELPVAFLGRFMSKKFYKMKKGIDSEIFNESIKIMKNFFDLIDWESLNLLEKDAEIVVKIRFNPKDFINRMILYYHFTRDYEGFQLYQEMPDISEVKEYLEERDKKTKKEFKIFKKQFKEVGML